jgi:hypothetical protein
MHLRPIDCRPACLFWTLGLLNRDSQLVLGDGCQCFGQFACRPAGYINFIRAGIINNSPGRQVFGGDQGEMLGQGRCDGEVACSFSGVLLRRDAPSPAIVPLFDVSRCIAILLLYDHLIHFWMLSKVYNTMFREDDCRATLRSGGLS